MHVHDDGTGHSAQRMRFEDSIQRRKRIIKRAFHEHLPQRLGDQHLLARAGLEQARPFAGGGFGEVQRPDDARLLIYEGQHVLLVKRVITQRQTISAGIQQILGMRARKAHARRCVLAVDHDEIEFPLAAQPRQIFGDGAAPGAAHHIPEKEYFHRAIATRLYRRVQEPRLQTAYKIAAAEHKFFKKI